MEAPLLSQDLPPLVQLLLACSLCVLLLHLVHVAAVARLTGALGQRAVLVTGWLGVPLHEASHATACILFGHRIRRMVWLSLDSRSDRLGEVQHSYDKRRPLQRIGNPVIALAPLVAGSFAIQASLWLHFRDASPADIGPSDVLPPLALIGQGGQVAWHLLRQSADLDLSALGTAYIVLCIGAHMLPSIADMKSAYPGHLTALAVVGVVALIPLLPGAPIGFLTRIATTALEGLLEVSSVAAGLAAAYLLAVVVMTFAVSRFAARGQRAA